MMAAGGGSAASASQPPIFPERPPGSTPPPLTAGVAARQSRADRFLDLLLHQLPAYAALHQGLEREVQRQRAGDHRRPHAGVSLRKRSSRTSRKAVQRSGHHLSGCRWITTTRSGGASTMNTGPRDYFIDAQGQASAFTTLARAAYEESRTVDPHPARQKQTMGAIPETMTKVAGSGTEAAPDCTTTCSLLKPISGMRRAENFASPGGFNQNDPQGLRSLRPS